VAVGADGVSISPLRYPRRRRIQSSSQITAFTELNKQNVIVLEDVKGVTLTLGFGNLAAKLDVVAAEAKKVLDSVEWRGSWSCVERG
jgi:hypothetical protein